LFVDVVRLLWFTQVLGGGYPKLESVVDQIEERCAGG
jgi:hypothetical protein